MTRSPALPADGELAADRLDFRSGPTEHRRRDLDGALRPRLASQRPVGGYRAPGVNTVTAPSPSSSHWTSARSASPETGSGSTGTAAPAPTPPSPAPWPGLSSAALAPTGCPLATRPSVLRTLNVDTPVAAAVWRNVWPALCSPAIRFNSYGVSFEPPSGPGEPRPARLPRPRPASDPTARSCAGPPDRRRNLPCDAARSRTSCTAASPCIVTSSPPSHVTRSTPRGSLKPSFSAEDDRLPRSAGRVPVPCRRDSAWWKPVLIARERLKV